MKKIKSFISKTGHSVFKRIWAEGESVRNGGFEVGRRFVWSASNGRVRILPEEAADVLKSVDGKGKVSYRTRKGKTIPVIDINNLKVLKAFEGCTECKITIYENEIVVEKVQEEKEQYNNKSDSKSKTNKIINLRAKRENKVNKVVIPNYMLDIVNVIRRKVAGFDNQLSFFDLEDEYTKDHYQESISSGDIAKLGRTYSLLSTFSGMGGFDKGFQECSIIPKFAIDYSLDKILKDNHIKTYKHNFGNHIIDCDISKFDFKCKNIKEAFPNGVDVLIGGPPCQDYSVRNKKSSFYTKIIETPKNKLIFHFMRAIKETNPLVFVMENVKEILIRGKAFIDVLKIELGALGYQITTTILKGKDLGMAQHRQRAILIGSKIGKITIEMPKMVKVETVRDVLNSISPDAPNGEYPIPVKKDVIERLNILKPGQKNQDLPERLRCNYKSIYEKLSLDVHCGTIDNVAKRYLQHPSEPRVISLREAMAFQGFDNSFKLITDSLNAGYQMIGNSVPVQFSKVIAQSVRKALDRYYQVGGMF